MNTKGKEVRLSAPLIFVTTTEGAVTKAKNRLEQTGKRYRFNERWSVQKVGGKDIERSSWGMPRREKGSAGGEGCSSCR